MAIEWERMAKERGFDSPKDMLTKLYIEDGYTLDDIATMFGCSSWAISRELDRLEIERRRHGGVRRVRGKPSLADIENVLQKLKEEAK